MNKEKVGSVTEQEKEEIKKLYERKNALKEIIPSLNSGLLTNEQKDELYERVVQDMVKTNAAFQRWWDEKGEQYNWKSVENGNWNIDFETNEIYLITKLSMLNTKN